MPSRETHPHLDWDWIEAQAAKLPPMSDRQARAISFLLFGTDPVSGWDTDPDEEAAQ